MRIALLHNLRPDPPPEGLPDDAFEECDSAETIESVASALRLLSVEVDPIVADRQLPWRLRAGNYDFAFNIAEGEGRRCREAIPAAVCELLGLPFTGSDALTLALALDKSVARRVVWPDVPVARALLVDGERVNGRFASLEYPVVVKPNDEGSSKGIREASLAGDAGEAALLCGRLRSLYGCPVLVEEYLPGVEVTVGVVGNGSEARVLGMMEVAPTAGENPFLYSLEVKRDFRRRVRYHIPPRLPAASLAELSESALTVYRLLGCRDLARIDFRLDAAGRPRFLECNPLPGLDPESGDIVILSREAIPYESLVQGVLLDAARRLGISLG